MFKKHYKFNILEHEEISAPSAFNLLNTRGYLMHRQLNIQQLYTLPTLYLCVLYLFWEQTAIFTTYIINWLVFITEMKSVYSAVRTGSLNKSLPFVFKNKCTIISQIITLLHVSTLSCHFQGACNQILAKLHKRVSNAAVQNAVYNLSCFT
jgi:hypothetical protein